MAAQPISKKNKLVMKITHISIALILVFISTTSFLLCSAAEAPNPVLDIAKNKIRAGVNYYILPVVRGHGGGLALASRGNSTCPLGVVLEQHEVVPLSFSPVNSKKGIVHVSTDHNIRFDASSICVQSTIWRLDQYDESTKQYFITTGGVEGNPGIGTISNWFKIEEYESDYKIVFCPTVCNYCKVICRDVGIFLLDGRRRLALSDVPFRVMFKKASK